MQARQLHKQSNPELEAMRRVTGLTDLNQSQAFHDNIGEIILTTKSPRELVGEIYVLQEQLQAVVAENAKLHEKLASSTGMNSSEILKVEHANTKRKYSSLFLKKRFTTKMKSTGNIGGSKDFDIVEEASASQELGA